jgi:hypothetical protein
MNQDGLLIPKEKVTRGPKSGFPPAFWAKQWDELDIVTSLQYDANRKSLQSGLQEVSAHKNQKHVYADVVLKPEAEKSKAMRPSRVWAEAGLEVIESKNNNVVTVSGASTNFEKLQQIISSASYEVAKTGHDAAQKVKLRERDMYRELFAVSAFNDRSASITDRIDGYIEDRIKTGEAGPVDCVIEIRPDIDKLRYDDLYELLNNNLEGTVTKRDIELFYASNISFLANLLPYEIRALLGSETFSFIKIIRRKPSYTGQRSPRTLDLTNIPISAPATNIAVGVVDSGIDNGVINQLKTRHQIKHTRLPEDKNHGTFVASRVIFGHDLNLLYQGKIKTLEPLCKVMDIHVLGTKVVDGRVKLGADDDLDIIAAVTDAVLQHKEIKIFNISIAEDFAADRKDITDLTVTLDELSNEHDVLFILAAGNHKAHLTNDYGKIFSHTNGHDVGVAPPGDAVNGLTVGAIAYDVGGDAMAEKKYYPAPFSRIGNVRNGVRKPELVEARTAMPDTMVGPINPNMLAIVQHGVIAKFQRADGSVDNLPDAVIRFGSDLMRRFVLDDIGQDPTTGVLYAGTMAMLNLPSEGYEGGKVPKRSKGRETDQQTLFRNCISYLRDQASVNVAVDMKDAAVTGKALYDMAKAAYERFQSSPDDDNAAREWEDLSSRVETHSFAFRSAYIAKYEAEALLNALTEARFTAAQAGEEMRALELSFNEREAKRSQWHFLPPKPSGPRGEVGPGDGTQVEDYIRQERIDELHSLVDQWGDGHVEESDFVAGTNRRYLAAILPQHLPDGQVVEHAVLDTSRYGNRLFLLRADRPAVSGQPLREWPEVFDEQYKPEAEANGAIGVVHRGNWRDRVLDYLTRKPDELPQK